MSATFTQSAPVPVYSVTDVGFLPGFTEMTGTAINFEGDIVGSAGDNEHGFLYHHGKLTDLGAGVIPVKINNSKQILEKISSGSVLYEYKSRLSTPLPNEGIDLNNAGEVLLADTGFGGYVSIWHPSGAVVTHLVGIQGEFGNFFYPWALNDLGQVVGRDFTVGINGINNVVLVQPNGTYKTIAVASTTVLLPTENYVFPLAINIRGQVAGNDLNQYWDNVYQNPSYAEYAALYDRGQNILLGNIITQAEGGVSPGGKPPDSVATGINNLGVIVGYCQGAGVHRAFVYLKGTMYDLNTLVNSTGESLTITSASAINDLGQIVGTAVDAAGNDHAVILSVVKRKDFDVLK